MKVLSPLAWMATKKEKLSADTVIVPLAASASVDVSADPPPSRAQVRQGASSS